MANWVNRLFTTGFIVCLLLQCLSCLQGTLFMLRTFQPAGSGDLAPTPPARMEPCCEVQSLPSLQAVQPRSHKAALQRPGIPKLGPALIGANSEKRAEHPQFQYSLGSAHGLAGRGATAARGPACVRGRGETQNSHAAQRPRSSSMMYEHAARLHKAAAEH